MRDGIIRALSRDVADKIAAGEVVERPLSIVKELVENSIDAGSTAITVEISKGGKEYIRVTDNGCGIPKDQLELAFMRYATSKLSTEDDLLAIETLGFRGEALASIAAVSQTELITKTAGAKTGAKISISASEIITIEDAACEEGTTIIVKNLFYNVPARLKFLKPDNTESSLVTDFVSKIAIAYPNIRVRLISNGSVLFSTQGKNSLKNAILTVYSPRIAQNLVQCAREEGTQKIYGYISSPRIFEKNRRKQIFFVNGRLIKSRVLEQALADAYKDKLFDNQYPSCFLFLNIAPSELDVNIHPHKTEVRFYNEKLVYEFVMRSVRLSLLDPVSMEFKAPQINAKTEPIAEVPKATQKLSEKAVLEEASAFIPSPEKDEEPVSVAREIKVERPLGTAKYFEEKPVEILKKPQIIQEEKPAEPSNIFAMMRKEEQAKQTEVQEELFEYNKENKFSFEKLTFCGSVFDTYLLLKNSDGLYVMDQHAAAERVMYEKLIKRFNSEPDPAQQLLTPILMELEISQKQASLAVVDELTALGFEISDFGPSTWAVNAIPECMNLEEAESFLDEFFSNISEAASSRQAKNRTLTMRACKSAVKAHDKLSDAEVLRLLCDLDKCENPFSCPHGRPTFIKFTEYELERLFKRK